MFATRVTVTVADGLDVPSMANEAGDAVQVAPEGAEHVRAIACLKPFSGAAVTWKVAVPPAEAALMDCWEVVRVKSTAPGTIGVPPVPVLVPLPVSAMDCGEFAATPVTVRLEATLPATVGAKVTWIVQLALAARVAGLTGQLFVCLKPLAIVIVEMVRVFAEEPFVNVTVFAVLVVPIV